MSSNHRNNRKQLTETNHLYLTVSASTGPYCCARWHTYTHDQWDTETSALPLPVIHTVCGSAAASVGVSAPEAAVRCQAATVRCQTAAVRRQTAAVRCQTASAALSADVQLHRRQSAELELCAAGRWSHHSASHDNWP